MKYMKREQGFTLIELLVVIAILGILAAVVIPAVAGFIGEGEEESAKTEMHNVNTAVTALMADPDRPCSKINELPGNSGTYCDGTATSPCTNSMAALAALGAGETKYGINAGSTVADYMESDTTNWFYCTTIKGRVSGFLMANDDPATNCDATDVNNIIEN